MKETVLSIAAVILVLTGGLASCNKSNSSKTIDSNMFFEQLKSAPHADVPRESLPEWLVDRINDTEAKPVSTRGVQVYKGEWNKQNVYFIVDSFSSCFCDFYTEDGERIVLPSEDVTSEPDSFYSKNRNWVLIYEFGEGLCE